MAKVKGKVEMMNRDTLEIKIDREKTPRKVGKKVFTQNLFKVGDTIEYEIKGANFDFSRKISDIEKVSNGINNARNNNKNYGNNSVKTTFRKELVNYPYNFVSLGNEENIERGKVEKGINSGKLVCKLKNITPLFIGSGDDGAKVVNANGHTREYFMREKDKYIIPASSLKGEVRNIIEVLTTSCIKNVKDVRLEKRLQANKELLERNLKCGIVKNIPTEQTDGLIVEAVKIKIHHSALEGFIRKKGNDYREGFYPIKVNKTIANYIYQNEKNKNVVGDKETFDRILKNGTETAILWVSSPIFKKNYEKIIVAKNFISPGKGKNYKFSKAEYDDLGYLIEQRNERIKAKNSKAEDFYIEKNIKVNEAIIFEESEDYAFHLTFSEIPRLRYKLSPYDLIPKVFRPCNDIKNLCFACRMFGTTGNHEEEKVNKEIVNSRMGRVYFTDAEINKNEAKILQNPRLLKALGEPHASLARFYLKNGDYDNDNAKIRGRKFYWHHTDKIEAGSNFEKYMKLLTPPKEEKYNASLQFMEPENEFSFEVGFKNLTDEELGILIYSLELEKDMLHKLGKAKAFGFGSCEIKIEKLQLESRDKYKSFTSALLSEDKEKYLEKAKEKYILENKKEIKELKTILNIKNTLDFRDSPFPEDIDKKGEKNTLNWFMNNKSVILPEILDYKKK